MSLCNYCFKPIPSGYDIWYHDKPYHPDCAIQVAVTTKNNRQNQTTKRKDEPQMNRKTEKKTVEKTEKKPQKNGKNTTPVKRDCAFCGQHILATTQVPWQGKEYHEDCIGNAIEAKNNNNRNVVQFPQTKSEPEEYADVVNYNDYPDYNEEFYDEYDGEYEFPEEDLEYRDGMDETDDLDQSNAEVKLPSGAVMVTPRAIIFPPVQNNVPESVEPIEPEVILPRPMVSVGSVANQVVSETIEKAKRAGTLMTHAGAKRITRNDLALLPVPEETATFKPIPHKDLVDRIMDTLWYRRMTVVREEYAVSPDGMKLFGLLEIDLEYKGVRFAIGLRNSNDKSMRVAMVAGYRVTVCDNMMLQGDFQPLLAKHSKHFALEDGLSIACDRIQRNIGGLNQQITAKQEKVITNESARDIIYRAFLLHKLPMSLMRTVHQEYFIQPSYEEFAANTLWSLENAFTTSFKKLQPVSQFEATAKLGKFLAAYN